MSALLRPVAIVLEGLDATGKTTLAELLAARLGAELLATPDRSLREPRKHIDRAYSGDGLASQLFYASAVAHASKQLSAALAEGRSVVIDRYWISTKVNDLVRPGAVDLAAVEDRLVPPTVTVLLETEEPERLRRLQQRGEMTLADRDSVAHRDRLAVAYRSALAWPIAGTGRVVDTTRCSPEKCADLVIASLEEVIR